MTTERGGEEAPTTRINPQQKPSKRREDGWKKASEGLQGCRAELLLGPRSQTRNREGGRAGFYKDRKMSFEGKRDHSTAYIRHEDGILFRDVELIHERWFRWFHTLFNAKSPKLDPNIGEGLHQ